MFSSHYINPSHIPFQNPGIFFYCFCCYMYTHIPKCYVQHAQSVLFACIWQNFRVHYLVLNNQLGKASLETAISPTLSFGLTACAFLSRVEDPWDFFPLMLIFSRYHLASQVRRCYECRFAHIYKNMISQQTSWTSDFYSLPTYSFIMFPGPLV